METLTQVSMSSETCDGSKMCSAFHDYVIHRVFFFLLMKIVRMFLDVFLLFSVCLRQFTGVSPHLSVKMDSLCFVLCCSPLLGPMKYIMWNLFWKKVNLVKHFFDSIRTCVPYNRTNDVQQFNKKNLYLFLKILQKLRNSLSKMMMMAVKLTVAPSVCSVCPHPTSGC